MSIQGTLRELGITLPAPPKPVGAYIPCVRTGNLLFVSVQDPLVDGALQRSGKVDRGVSIEEGQGLARQAALNALAVISGELGGLDRVKRVVRLGVYVASSEDFTDQPKVANGASELLTDVFGDAGRHARFAVGLAELPLGSPLELEMIVEVTEA